MLEFLSREIYIFLIMCARMCDGDNKIKHFAEIVNGML